MKKTLSMAAIALFMMTASCSGDDSSDSNPSTETVLIKKTISTDEEGYEITSNYVYSGTKILNMTDTEDQKVSFIYTEDLITRMDYYEDEILVQQDIFEYNENGQLSSYLMLLFEGPSQGEYGRKSVYTYNTDGTITDTVFIGNHESQPTQAAVYTITIENGNVVDNGVSTYTYDNKHNPRHNITGMTALNIVHADGLNNMTSETLGTQIHTTVSYDYNEAGYPISGTETDIDGAITTMQYFYE